jgi:hypothetical protein
VVHFSQSHGQDADSGAFRVAAISTLELMVNAILAARSVLDKSAYWGPVRVIHQFRFGSPFHVTDPVNQYTENYDLLTQKAPVQAGQYEHVVPEVRFADFGDSIRPILVELLHQVYQTSNDPACPWFDTGDYLRKEMRGFLPSELVEYLEQ